MPRSRRQIQAASDARQALKKKKKRTAEQDDDDDGPALFPDPLDAVLALSHLLPPGAAQCDCQELLLGLQCPYTWGYSPMTLMQCEYVRDKLFQAGTPWNRTFDRLNLAFSLFCWGRKAEARAQLVNCYMHLLPAPYATERCPVMDDYREGFRHMLDSTWAGMCLAAREQPCKGMDPLLTAYVKTITPFDRLDRRQRAAVVVMQGRFGDDEGLLRLARRGIALDPAEGAWKLMLGWKLQELREAAGTPPADEEVSALRGACRLRRSPDSLTRLAKTLADAGPEGRAEARNLVDEAQRLYPDSPAVLFQVSNILPKLRVDAEDADEVNAQSEALLRRAIAVTGDRHAHLRMRLGLLQMARGNQAECTKEFDRGLAINNDAAKVFTEVIIGKCKAMGKAQKAAEKQKK